MDRFYFLSGCSFSTLYQWYCLQELEETKAIAFAIENNHNKCPCCNIIIHKQIPSQILFIDIALIIFVIIAAEDEKLNRHI